MKKLFALAMLVLGLSASASAQQVEYSPAPHWFVTVQGGIQNTFNSEFNNWKTIRPSAAISVGRFFRPEIGARLNINGIYNRGAASGEGKPTGYYYYTYYTPSADALINLCTLFGKKDHYPVDVNIIAGLGWFRARNNDQAERLQSWGYDLTNTDKCPRNAMNARAGLQVEFNVNRNLSVNLEGTYNRHVFNENTFAPDNNQMLIFAGLNFKFGHKKVVRPVEEVWETRMDTIWYDEASYANRTEDGNISWNVFYKIRESDYDDSEAYLAKIGAFLKDHRECKIFVKSYADRGTGNPRVNMMYSQQRSEKAVKALVDAGVQESLITAEYFGDTVQPFEENDKNRVTIVTATGLKDIMDKKNEKKFRLEPVRVRVR